MPSSEKVLVTAVGSIVGQGIVKALKLANMAGTSVGYKIIGTDATPLAAGLYRVDRAIIVPPASAPEYVDSIISICKDGDIRAIFVGADEELIPLATAKERIEKETGSVVVASDLEVVEVATDKWRTFQFLKTNGLPHPESALPDHREEFAKEFGFPLVVKPREGHGSIHFYVVQDMGEMELAMASIEKSGWRPMLQEYLSRDDQEYTSGITVDRAGKSVMSSITMRRTIKNGQTYKAFVEDFEDVNEFAGGIALKLGATGPVNVQSRLSEDGPKAFEINPRFSATCPMRAVAGVNEVDIVFRNHVLGEEVKVRGHQRLVCMRYWNEVYVPYQTYKKLESEGGIERADSLVPSYF